MSIGGFVDATFEGVVDGEAGDVEEVDWLRSWSRTLCRIVVALLLLLLLPGVWDRDSFVRKYRRLGGPLAARIPVDSTGTSIVDEEAYPLLVHDTAGVGTAVQDFCIAMPKRLVAARRLRPRKRPLTTRPEGLERRNGSDIM